MQNYFHMSGEQNIRNIVIGDWILWINSLNNVIITNICTATVSLWPDHVKFGTCSDVAAVIILAKVLTAQNCHFQSPLSSGVTNGISTLIIILHQSFLLIERGQATTLGSRPVWARGNPLTRSLPQFLHFYSIFYFSLFPFLSCFTYVLTYIPSLYTRIGSLRFQAGGRRRRPNLGLVCILLLLAVF